MYLGDLIKLKAKRDDIKYILSFFLIKNFKIFQKIFLICNEMVVGDMIVKRNTIARIIHDVLRLSVQVFPFRTYFLYLLIVLMKRQNVRVVCLKV